jgi:hypothetical protein
MNEIILPLDLDIFLPYLFSLIGLDEYQFMIIGVVVVYFIGYFILVMAEHKV